MVARLSDGRVLIAGGDVPGTQGSNVSAVVELYDPTTDTWTDAPPMPEARHYGSAVALVGGTILIVSGGGFTGDAPVSAIRFIPSR
jgi:hypothetical protein